MTNNLLFSFQCNNVYRMFLFLFCKIKVILRRVLTTILLVRTICLWWCFVCDDGQRIFIFIFCEIQIIGISFIVILLKLQIISCWCSCSFQCVDDSRIFLSLFCRLQNCLEVMNVVLLVLLMAAECFFHRLWNGRNCEPISCNYFVVNNILLLALVLM